jgi:hypothetical protein
MSEWGYSIRAKALVLSRAWTERAQVASIGATTNGGIRTGIFREPTGYRGNETVNVLPEPG